MSRQDDNKASWSELILFVMIIACFYFILALFDSSLTGDGGREWGRYLRNAWGGAVIVPLLFWLYLCVAKLLKFRVIRIPRQVLGTIQLYISFAFLLGLLRETGWTSELTLFRPGEFGSGIAKFFVLNVGTFITLLLVIASFILSAFLFGAKILRVRLPSMPKIKFNRRKTQRRQRRKREHSNYYDDYDYSPSYSEYRPETILFTKNLPTPTLKPAPDDYYDDDYEDSAQISDIPAFIPRKNTLDFQLPKLKQEETEEKKPDANNPLEIIDDLIAKIDAGEMSAPEKKRTKSPARTKKIRRPLPAVTLPEELQNYDDTDTAEEHTHEEPAFPPPPELFGARAKIETDKDAQKECEKQGKAIVSTLKNFGVSASVAHTVIGASVVQYQLELAPGTKVNKIAGLSEDLAMALAVMSVRIEAPILGTHYAGVEIPNPDRKTIPLRNIIESDEFRNSSARLPLPLGVQIDGNVFVRGLEEIQHIIIAGNSDKSVFVNSCILSMCARRRPDELKLILIDPRHVEFSVYDGLPHLLASPVSDTEGALKALHWAYGEMEKRTAEFAGVRVRNLATYNRKRPKEQRLPEIVIVIDELSDLMYSAGNEIEGLVVRLAQKAGAAGIYLMTATQRPSPDVITSLIKSNISTRAVFRMSSGNDAKSILGVNDADKLTGKGDMLFRSTATPQALRLQTGYIDEEKISEFVEYMISNLEPPELITL